MAEVEDDYDDESCSSSEGPNERLDRMEFNQNELMSRKHAEEATQLVSQTLMSRLEAKVDLMPLASTVTMSPAPSQIASEHSVADEAEMKEVSDSGGAKLPPSVSTSTADPANPAFHEPRGLPTFREPKMCMWTSSHAANSPSEDRSCSLVNVLLRPLSLDDQARRKPDNGTLIRVSLWAVIDGHGGGCVATYASEVLLPHIAASMSRALKCDIVDRGVCTVNGELRDANALDLDGLIRTSDRSRVNPNSVQYRSPYEVDAEADDHLVVSEEDTVTQEILSQNDDHGSSSVQGEGSISSQGLRLANVPQPDVASVKTSVKTAVSNPHVDAPVGTHSPGEVVAITQAITESFLAVDEGWINSIDPVATHQTSCQSNGRWNAGACALVVFTVQRLEWTSASLKNRRAGMRGQDPRDDTSHNKDAARRRMLDYAAKAKSASSMSTISSTSSMLTEDDPNVSAFESEITEDEGEESDLADPSRKSKAWQTTASSSIPEPIVIITPGGCDCHVYRPHEAMLYTAHVGDCRAVLLGSAPPRTIKVRPVGGTSKDTTDHPDTTDDESSYHSSDETECLSSSDHDAESSDEDDADFNRKPVSAKTPPYLKYMRRPSCRSRRRRDLGNHAPFVALPPLPIAPHSSSDESDSESETLAPPVKPARLTAGHDSDENSNESSLLSPHGRVMSPPLELAPFTRPIDLTTDHSAYNPAEVTAVLRRCSNAPRAISAGVGGGIKRVAGSLAVTRALGDAYLKTPLLSFNPYKDHAPYIEPSPSLSRKDFPKYVPSLSPEFSAQQLLLAAQKWHRRYQVRCRQQLALVHFE